MRILIFFISFTTLLYGQKIFKNVPEKIDSQGRYLFYLHGRIIEDKGDNARHPLWGIYKYSTILRTLANHNLNVISEQRASNTDVTQYADLVSLQVEKLLKAGVDTARITIMGASKGALIAKRVSSRLKIRSLKYIILAGCNDVPENDSPLYGDILSVYEASDDIGNSCQPLIEQSKGAGHFEEVKLNTGLQHGFFYQPRDEWLKPVLRFVNSWFLPNEITIEQISPSCYIHKTVTESKDFGRFSSNGLVYVNNHEALMMDTPVDSNITAQLLDWFESRQIHIKAVVVNHWHSDAIGGLPECRRRGIVSYGNTLTATLAMENHRMPPEKTFSDSLTLTAGGKNVLCRYYGAGHALDNIAVWIPDEKILFGGCMIKSLGASKGNLSDADTTAWPHTVEKLKAAFPDVKTVIPGHGDYGDKALLDYTIEMFRKK